MNPGPTPPNQPHRSPSERLTLCVAQGFGSGLAPVAPGTFGSLLGLPWLFLCLLPAHPLPFLACVLLGLAISVHTSHQAERLLQQHDPGSVVIDEISALPIAYVGFIYAWQQHHGSWPAPLQLLTPEGALPLAIGFVVFRLLDALKPWPISAIQRLPGGWGITADDLLAALLTNLAWVFWPF